MCLASRAVHSWDLWRLACPATTKVIFLSSWAFVSSSLGAVGSGGGWERRFLVVLKKEEFRDEEEVPWEVPWGGSLGVAVGV